VVYALIISMAGVLVFTFAMEVATNSS